MAKDPRIRGIRAHIAADREPVVIEWACDEQREVFRYGPSPVCASGGFGCIGGDTKLYCADTGEHVSVRELNEKQISPVVLGWDGGKFVKVAASIPFIKGRSRLYRVTTKRGRRVDVTDRHYFLTSYGWASIGDNGLIGEHGGHLLGCDGDLLPSNLECGLSILPAGDENLRDRESDFQSCYHFSHGSRGGQLPWDEGIYRLQLPSPGGVQERSHYVDMDGWVTGGGHIRAIWNVLLSNLDVLVLSMRRAAGWGIRTNCSSGVPVQTGREDSEFSRFRGNSIPARKVGGFGNDIDSVLSGCASWDSVLSIEDLGIHQYYDISVPIVNNYLAEGLIHHNSAKTYALCLKALYLSDTYPNNRGLIARRVYEELKNTTVSTFFKLCPPEAYERGRRADSEKYLRLNNGSEILWMHLEDPDAANILRGLEINWFLLDQAEEIDEEIFTILLTRLGRWDKAVVPQREIEANGGIDEWAWKNPAGKPIVPTYAMLACNPDTELHWIYQMFHPESDQWKAKYRARGYKMFFFDSRNNKFLPKQNLDAMMQQDASFVRRFVAGVWGIPEGTIHTIEPESLLDYTFELVEYLRRNCNLFRTLDHGDSSPTCCVWWAVDHDGNVFGYREYYQPGLLISDHRKEISALSVNERYTGNYADPQVSFKTMQKHGGMWSIADEYSDCVHYDRATALFWVDADNNELGTRNRINEYLRVDPNRIHPVTKCKGAPRLYFVQACESYQQGCRYVVKETRAQKRIKIGSEQGKAIFSDERNDRIPDHAYDNLRYMIASRPPVATGQKGVVYGKDSFEAWRRTLERFHKSGDHDRMVRLAKLERARERQQERMARLNG